jgi:hypothetical protein
MGRYFFKNKSKMILSLTGQKINIENIILYSTLKQKTEV